MDEKTKKAMDADWNHVMRVEPEKENEMNEKCENCRYVRASRHISEREWHCRRYPPKNLTTTNVSGSFPRVGSGDLYWCGEFRPKETESKG